MALKHTYRACIDWLQHSDLVPFLVIVSAWHYIGVLVAYDPVPVAVAVGLLVDLGHCRGAAHKRAVADNGRVVVEVRSDV